MPPRTENKHPKRHSELDLESPKVLAARGSDTVGQACNDVVFRQFHSVKIFHALALTQAVKTPKKKKMPQTTPSFSLRGDLRGSQQAKTRCVTGVEGFEPSITVLETGVMPFHYTPLVNYFKRILSEISYAVKQNFI